jgi:3-dehydroquinate synthase
VYRSSLTRKLQVKAGETTYPVLLSDFKRQLQTHLGDSRIVAVVSNPKVFALHGAAFIDNCLAGKRYAIEPVLMGDGERFKSQKTINNLHHCFFEIGLNRTDTVITLGGGVVGDTAGFAAATFKRGVNLVQVPTTLLAMVDSSVGGKVGINHAYGKNLIGAFYQPRAVLTDPGFLGTLGRREMIEGVAEILKAGFLSGRRFLRAAGDMPLQYSAAKRDYFTGIISEAIRFKAGIVARDPYDAGLRQILNFGHTFGHAIEKVEKYRRYHHGEAVLAGMAAALHLSRLSGLLSNDEANECLHFLSRFVSHLKPLGKDPDDYLVPMEVDKKRMGEDIVCVMLNGIGRPVVGPVRSRKRLKESIQFMIEFVKRKGVV